MLLQFAVSAQTSAGVQCEIADLHQRLRVAVDTIRHDIMLAGAGPSRGPARGPLSQVFAPIVPPESVSRSRPRVVISPRSHQPALRSRQCRAITPRGGHGDFGLVRLLIDGRCTGLPSRPPRAVSCGRRRRALRADGAGGAHEVFTIGSVDAATSSITPSAALSRPYSRRRVVAAVIQRTFYLDQSGKRLMVYDGGQSDVPLVDHVVALHFAYLR